MTGFHLVNCVYSRRSLLKIVPGGGSGREAGTLLRKYCPIDSDRSPRGIEIAGSID